VGPGATVGTLSIGYPAYKLQVKTMAPALASRPGVCSGTATYPHGYGPCLPARGSSGAAMCPRGSSGRPPARGSSGVTACHLGSNTHLLAQDSSGGTTCLEEGLCMLQAIKQISLGDPAIMITIGARAHISSKALHDKGCFARSQGVQQMAH
jgi:hypothetical protein